MLNFAIFIPLISSILIFFSKPIFILKNNFEEKIILYCAVFLLFLNVIISIYIFKKVALDGNIGYLHLGTWFNFYHYTVSWSLYFDSLTVVMLVVVNFISFLVNLYSLEYMKTDKNIIRFFSYLALFTFFMLILISSENLIQLFLGWEGVGLSSYLLINFWHTRVQANKAAMKAMIVNRIGDMGLTLGIIGCLYLFHSVRFSVMFPLVYKFYDDRILFLGFEINVLAFISLCIFIGAMGKSAQLGLHTWLPDAMEGPTPVSALIHAATMVTAGVFVLIRCSIFFEFVPKILFFISIIGGLTAFFAATTGIVQNDLKKVIAYSTCSQLGYMVFACGLSNYSVSMFHLANHAFFKALLFLSAGCVIHALFDEQDMRKMGGLYQLLPITYIMMLIGSLALMGIPYFTGFYSKDLILETAYGNYFINGLFVFWLGIISAFFTAFYSFRSLYMTFLASGNFPRKFLYSIHEAPVLMMIPLILLGLGSIFIGYLTKDMLVGLGSDFFTTSIYNSPYTLTIIESEFIPVYIKLLPLIFTLLGASLPFVLNFIKNEYISKFYENTFILNFYKFFNQKWYFDNLYNKFIISNVLMFSYNVTFKALDRGLVETPLGPLGLARYISDFKNLIFDYFKKNDISFITTSVLFLIVPIFISFIFCLSLDSSNLETLKTIINDN